MRRTSPSGLIVRQQGARTPRHVGAPAAVSLATCPSTTTPKRTTRASVRRRTPTIGSGAIRPRCAPTRSPRSTGAGRARRRRRSPPPVATAGARRPWGAVVAAGTAGAVLAGVGVAVLGVGERVVERPVTERVALDSDRVAPSEAPATGATDGGAAAHGAHGGRRRTGGRHDGGSGVVVRDDGIVVTSAALVVAGAAPCVRLPDGRTPRGRRRRRRRRHRPRGARPGRRRLHPQRPRHRRATWWPASRSSALGAAAARRASPPTDGVVGDAERYVGPHGHRARRRRDRGRRRPVGPRRPGRPTSGARCSASTTAVDDGEAWYVAPVEVADRVADDLLTDGVARHCWLGIEGTEPGRGRPPPHRGRSWRRSCPTARPPSAASGPATSIVALDDEDVADMADLLLRLRAHSPGDRVEVTVVRADESRGHAADPPRRRRRRHRGLSRLDAVGAAAAAGDAPQRSRRTTTTAPTTIPTRPTPATPRAISWRRRGLSVAHGAASWASTHASSLDTRRRPPLGPQPVGGDHPRVQRVGHQLGRRGAEPPPEAPAQHPAGHPLGQRAPWAARRSSERTWSPGIEPSGATLNAPSSRAAAGQRRPRRPRRRGRRTAPAARRRSRARPAPGAGPGPASRGRPAPAARAGRSDGGRGARVGLAPLGGQALDLGPLGRERRPRGWGAAGRPR